MNWLLWNLFDNFNFLSLYWLDSNIMYMQIGYSKIARIIKETYPFNCCWSLELAADWFVVSEHSHSVDRLKLSLRGFKHFQCRRGVTVSAFASSNDWCAYMCLCVTAATIITSTITKDPVTGLSSTSSRLQYTAMKEDVESQFTCTAKHVTGPDQVSGAETYPIYCK